MKAHLGTYWRNQTILHHMTLSRAPLIAFQADLAIYWPLGEWTHNRIVGKSIESIKDNILNKFVSSARSLPPTIMNDGLNLSSSQVKDHTLLKMPTMMVICSMDFFSLSCAPFRLIESLLLPLDCLLFYLGPLLFVTLVLVGVWHISLFVLIGYSCTNLVWLCKTFSMYSILNDWWYLAERFHIWLVVFGRGLLSIHWYSYVCNSHVVNFKSVTIHIQIPIPM